MTDNTDSAQLLEELTAFCKSGYLSEDGLREIIGRNGWTPSNPTVQNYEFFHDACQNERVTEGILRCLIEYFPGAAAFADSSRSTPLHNALYCNKYSTLGMVQLLIDAFPDSLRREIFVRSLSRKHQHSM